jgi:ribose 5-phosphate isomerase A
MLPLDKRVMTKIRNVGRTRSKVRLEIIDAPFDHQKLVDPFTVSDLKSFGFALMMLKKSVLKILAQIKMLTGVLEVGLFCRMAKAAYFGDEV